MTTTMSTTDRPPLAATPAADDPEGAAPAAGDDPKRMGLLRWIAWQFSPRRKYVINREKQLRSAFLVVVVVLLLLVPLNYSLHAVRQQESATIAASNPELRPLMESRARIELVVGLLASLVIMAGVFVLTIIETHRTSGAAFAIKRRLELVRQGRLDAELHLRGGDNLRELEAPFNAMTEALRNRAAEEADALEEIADQVAGIIVPQEAHSLAARLRQLARRRRESVGLA
jgi:methyl-accepting chemotaxis protein